MNIHIFGASGSGTTTLAKALSKKLNCDYFDSDNYFWEKTDPPFKIKRTTAERQKLLEKDLLGSDSFVLSGSLCGWGDKFIPMFDLVVYLWIPEDIRIERIKKREVERYGDKIKVGGPMYESSVVFIEWASNYDNGDIHMRSRKSHELWLVNIPCDVLRIEEDVEVSEKIARIINEMKKILKSG